MAKNIETGERLEKGDILYLKVDFNLKKHQMCFESEFVDWDKLIPGYHPQSSIRIFNIVAKCNGLVRCDLWQVKVSSINVTRKLSADRRSYIYIDVIPLQRIAERLGEFNNGIWTVTEVCGDNSRVYTTLPARREVKKYCRANEIVHIEEIASITGKILSQKVILTEPDSVYFSSLIGQIEENLKRPLRLCERERIVTNKKMQLPSWPTA
jgi:hypothetical protein